MTNCTTPDLIVSEVILYFIFKNNISGKPSRNQKSYWILLAVVPGDARDFWYDKQINLT